MDILELEPRPVWKHFYDMTQIPRCSKDEDRIREHILVWAGERGLETEADDVGNIVVRRPGSPGHEDAPVVILQGHMDMVCEKNSDVEHDFATDPIKPRIVDGYVKATGTTLGADNGIGAAIAMAILEDDTIECGPIEALFTVDEETGLTGAFALSDTLLRGRILLNLDSEDEGVITIGCAGGGDSKISVPVTYDDASGGRTFFTIKVSGLKGGHSGVDIHLWRGNANKCLTRLLLGLDGTADIRIAEMIGGNKRNAISREAYATVGVADSDIDAFKDRVASIADEIKAELKVREPDLTVDVSEADAKPAMTSDDGLRTLRLIKALPHGIQNMSPDIEDLVETSTNLAIVRTEPDTNELYIEMSTRSSVSTALQNVRDSISSAVRLAGGSVEEGTPYPGWAPNINSHLLKVAKEVHEASMGYTPKVEAIHAGLECGIIGEKFPGMDMISIGPTIKYPHSPDECVEIEAVGKFWTFLTEILKKLAE